jgi:glycoside/pentoside/hexuronide:cation symporter, GPH family
VATTPTPPSPQPAGDRLKTGEYIGYALGDTASNFFFQTFNIFLTYYYVDVWGIPATALLWLIPLVRAFGAFDDVIMGLIADRTNTRWGKFRPYLLFGALPYGICGILMFAGPTVGPYGSGVYHVVNSVLGPLGELFGQNWVQDDKVIYAFITYALMLVSYTVINVPYSAMLGVISPSPRTRTVASTYRFVGAFGAAFLISLFVRPLVKYLGAESEIRGFQLTMAIFAVISVVLILITFASTKERVTPPPQQKTNVREELGELFKNWPWVMLLIASIFSNAFSALRSGSTIFYFKYVQGYDSNPFLWGLDRTTLFLTSGALGLVLGTLCLGPIARKIDKKYYATALSMVTGLSFLAFFFIPKGQFGLMIAVNMVAQFCAGPTSALTWALYGDVADYGEQKYGRRSTGLIYSASLFSIKTGILVGAFLVPLFLDRFGYVKGAAQQTAHALLGITIAFSLGPALFALLKAAALLIYPLNQKRVDEIERELAARRAANTSAAPEPKLV